MARGDKTKAAGVVAMASFGTALFDLTGTSAVICLSSGTGFAIGSTYHATRGSMKLIKEGMASNREKKAAANTLGVPPAVHVDMQEMFENNFRRLAASLFGCSIQGTLFCVMPHAGVGLAINVTELTYTKHKLSQLSRSVGGKRKLMSMVSLRNAGVQALAGLLIKGTVSTLFLGSEVDTFLDTAHKSVEAFSMSGAENIEAAQEFRKEMVHLHPFAETTALASALPDEYKHYIGLESRFESLNMDGEMEIRWGDPVTSGETLAVGAYAAASDVVVKNVVEMPLDNGVKKLSQEKGR